MCVCATSALSWVPHLKPFYSCQVGNAYCASATENGARKHLPRYVADKTLLARRHEQPSFLAQPASENTAAHYLHALSEPSRRVRSCLAHIDKPRLARSRNQEGTYARHGRVWGAKTGLAQRGLGFQIDWCYILKSPPRCRMRTSKNRNGTTYNA